MPENFLVRNFFFSQEIFDPSNPKISRKNFFARNGLKMLPLGKIFAQDFQILIAALTKLLGRRGKSIVPVLQKYSKQKRLCRFYKNTPNKNAHSMYGGDCDAAIAKAAAAVTHVQSQSRVRRLFLGIKGWGCCVLVCHRNGLLMAGGRAVKISPLIFVFRMTSYVHRGSGQTRVFSMYPRRWLS